MLTQQLTTWAVHLLILNKDLHHQALIYYENLLKMIDGLIQTQAEQDRDSQKQLQTLCPPHSLAEQSVQNNCWTKLARLRLALE